MFIKLTNADHQTILINTDRISTIVQDKPFSAIRMQDGDFIKLNMTMEQIIKLFGV